MAVFEASAPPPAPEPNSLCMCLRRGPKKEASCIEAKGLSRLPKQDNHCDCGLFLLCYVEFFCHAQPRAILWEHIKGMTSGAPGERPWLVLLCDLLCCAVL